MTLPLAVDDSRLVCSPTSASMLAEMNRSGKLVMFATVETAASCTSRLLTKEATLETLKSRLPTSAKAARHLQSAPWLANFSHISFPVPAQRESFPKQLPSGPAAYLHQQSEPFVANRMHAAWLLPWQRESFPEQSPSPVSGACHSHSQSAPWREREVHFC